MQKVGFDYIEELKSNSIDSFSYPKGNFWIYHYKVDNKFYGVKHVRGQYYVSKGTAYFTDILNAIWCSTENGFVNPANSCFWK